MKVVFFGTPDFAVPTLEALVGAGHEVTLVVAQPDKPAGRGNTLRSPPVAERARALGLPLAQPKALRSGPFPERFAALAPDVAVVIAYGRILPPDLLARPRWGCVNVHASLLPRWRGAAPIQRAVLAGDEVTGVSTQRMVEGLDEGPLFVSLPTPIGARETSGSLHDRLMGLAAEAAVATLRIVDRVEPTPQPAEGITWAAKLEKEEARASFALPAEELDRRVRGYDPWPGAFVEGLALKETRPTEGSGAPGTVLSTDPLVVACGAGAVELVRVQVPGRKVVSGREYANGARLAVGGPVVAA